MAETVEGGRYQNKDGSFVDANGKVLKPAPVVVEVPTATAPTRITVK